MTDQYPNLTQAGVDYCRLIGIDPAFFDFDPLDHERPYPTRPMTESIKTSPKSRVAALVTDLLESHGVVVRISAHDLLDSDAGYELAIFRDEVSSSVQRVTAPTWAAASLILEGVAAGACLPAKTGGEHAV